MLKIKFKKYICLLFFIMALSPYNFKHVSATNVNDDKSINLNKSGKYLKVDDKIFKSDSESEIKKEEDKESSFFKIDSEIFEDCFEKKPKKKQKQEIKNIDKSFKNKKQFSSKQKNVDEYAADSENECEQINFIKPKKYINNSTIKFNQKGKKYNETLKSKIKVKTKNNSFFKMKSDSDEENVYSKEEKKNIDKSFKNKKQFSSKQKNVDEYAADSEDECEQINFIKPKKYVNNSTIKFNQKGKKYNETLKSKIKVKTKNNSFFKMKSDSDKENVSFREEEKKSDNKNNNISKKETKNNNDVKPENLDLNSAYKFLKEAGLEDSEIVSQLVSLKFPETEVIDMVYSGNRKKVVYVVKDNVQNMKDLGKNDENLLPYLSNLNIYNGTILEDEGILEDYINSQRPFNSFKGNHNKANEIINRYRNIFKYLVKNLISYLQVVKMRVKFPKGVSMYGEFDLDSILNGKGFYGNMEYFIKKYYNKIYNQPQRLGLCEERIIALLQEIYDKIFYDIFKDSDFYYYKQKYLRDFEIDGYYIDYAYCKMEQDYIIFKENLTGIRLIYFRTGKKLKDIIFIASPSDTTLKVLKNKKIKSNENYDVIHDEDGIKFVLKKGYTLEIIEELYDVLKEQFLCDESKITFLIRNNSLINRYYLKSIEGRDDCEDIKFYSLLLYLKEVFFNRLKQEEKTDYSEDSFVIFSKENEIKNDQTEDKNKSLYNCLEYEGEDKEKFFTNNGKEHEYVAEIIYNLNLPKARFKDAFNFDSGYFNDAFKNLDENYGFTGVSVVPQNQDDKFIVKFYGNDEKSFYKNNISKTAPEIIKKIIFDILDQSPKNSNEIFFKKESFDSNLILKRYEYYMKFKNKFLEYLKKQPDKNEFYHSLKKYTPTLRRSFSPIFVDWDENYRGYVPMQDLVMRSLAKYDIPFSEKVIDVEENKIEDYILRVYENVADGEEYVKKVLEKGFDEIKVYK